MDSEDELPPLTFLEGEIGEEEQEESVATEERDRAESGPEIMAALRQEFIRYHEEVARQERESEEVRNQDEIPELMDVSDSDNEDEHEIFTSLREQFSSTIREHVIQHSRPSGDIRSEDDIPGLMSVSNTSADEEEDAERANADWDTDEDDSAWEDEYESDNDMLERLFQIAGDHNGDLPVLERFVNIARSRNQIDVSELQRLINTPDDLAMLERAMNMAGDIDEDLPPLQRFMNMVHTARARVASMRAVAVAPGLSITGPQPPLNIQNIPGLFYVAGDDPELQGLASRELLESLLGTPIPPEGAVPAEQPLDKERAEMLVGALETLPEGLIKRIIHVGGAPGLYEDDSGEEAIVAGCAICWIPLLDPPPVMEHHANSSEESLPDLEPIESSEGSSSTPLEKKSRIVSLPCAHVFHSTCLLPWFSRNTSCPNCRFNLDPHNLTKSFGLLPFLPSADPQLQQVEEARGRLDDLEDVLRRELDPDTTTSTPPFGTGFYTWDPQGPRQRRSREKWKLPEAPGLSLRERIEEREREKGLRCGAKSCIFGPVDHDPYKEDGRVMRMVEIRVREVKGLQCQHLVHPSCLMQVKPKDRWPDKEDDEVDVDVVCPMCRQGGTVGKADWDEGQLALEVS